MLGRLHWAFDSVHIGLVQVAPAPPEDELLPEDEPEDDDAPDDPPLEEEDDEPLDPPDDELLEVLEDDEPEDEAPDDEPSDDESPPSPLSGLPPTLEQATRQPVTKKSARRFMTGLSFPREGHQATVRPSRHLCERASLCSSASRGSL